MAYPPPPSRPSRPIGVAILALLVILVGGLLTLVALLLIFASSLFLAGGAPLAGLALAGSFIFLILSLVLLGAGIGLWHLRPWAWWLSLIVLILIIANELSTVSFAGGLTSRELIAIGLPVLIFIYLLAVRHHFRSPAYGVPR